MKFMVWGLGASTQRILKSRYLEEARIVGFIDINERMFVHSGGHEHIGQRRH